MYHYNNVRSNRKKTKTNSKRKKSGRLTRQQKKTLMEHKSHHTPKHMRLMKRLMRKGISFNKAHRSALRKVGN